MKIAVIGPTYPTKGGISHYNTIMCKALEKKHNVECYSFKRLYWELLYPGVCEVDKNSKNKIETDANRIIDSVNPLTWLKTFRRLKKFNPDLVIMPWWTSWLSHVFFSFAFLTKKFTKAKVLFLCHNALPHKKELLAKPLTKLTFHYGDYFITHSKQDRDEIVSLKKSAYVKVGVHPIYDVFNQGNWNKTKIKNELGLKGNVIMFFGYVKEYKGLMYLIDAMPSILKEKDLTLIIVGEFWKPTKEEVLNRCKELKIENNVKIFDQYVPNEEVGKYYTACDVVVLPYISATNSGIVQTAFGFNKPVIVTNAGGLPDVVIDDVTGYIVPTENSKAIAKAVIKFYNNRDKINFEENIEKDKKRFEWDRLVELIESFMI